MTREEAKKFLPLIQAFAEGKEVQVRSTTFDEWQDIDGPSFNIDYEYRIKPEPKVIWVNEFISGGIDAFLTEEVAKSVESVSHKRVAVKYVEVIE